MASLKKMRGKYYSRIRKWNGVKQVEKVIPLKTQNKTDARIRHAQVQKHEKDIKAGLEFDFPWFNDESNITEIKPKRLLDSIHLFINSRISTDSYRASTISMNKRALNLFLDSIGDIPVKSISLEHIDQFIKNSNTLNHSKHTINIGLRIIRTFLIWMYDREIIKKRHKIKTLKTDHNEPKYLTEIEFNNLMSLDFGHKRFKLMYQLYWDTGLRLSEAFIGSINGNWLDISADMSKNHRQRSIMLNRKQIETVQILHELHGKNPNRDVIKWYSKKFKKGLLKIGIKDKHFHCLRHSFGARRIIETNGNIHLVRDEMGHSSVTVTERYTHLNRKRILDDFPSLKSSLKIPKTTIRDTLFRDTGKHLNTANRGGI